MAHKRVTVLPASDSHDMRGNWEVTVDGSVESTHIKKSAAKRTAKRLADAGDTLQIRRVDGTVMESRTVR